MSDETVVTLGPTPGDDVYLDLGRAIAGQCPSGFDEARLEADMECGVPMRLACTPQDGAEAPVELDAAARGRIVELLARIRDTTLREDEGPWRGCTVILRKGGRFQMDVHY